nr:uncharacterized protein LOC107428260 [Ziziphus jujuba var. spinosa]
MYVTRPLSLYRRSPESLSLPPPEGPNSGYLVILDEESEKTTCFGLCKDIYIRDLPFPQNKGLTISFTTGQSTFQDGAVLIPVLNQPLSTNCYYVMSRKGKHTGEASTSSKEEDTITCCWCCRCIQDVKPGPLDPLDEYQQVEIIHKKHGSFTAKSVVPDGHPPEFLRRKYWNIFMSTRHNYQLDEALGLDPSLRKRLPEFNNLSLSNQSSDSAIVVGKWYCPFMFVHEDLKLKDRMKISMFYEVTLEQSWQKIFSCDNNENDRSNVVVVDVLVQKEEVFINGGRGATIGDAISVNNGVMWFANRNSGGEERRVGLSVLVVERLKWEEERFGWVGGDEKKVKVESAEEYGGKDIGWTKFGCFVLVERFVFKRLDGSIVLSYDFKHTHQIRSKWE